jgi:integrase
VADRRRRGEGTVYESDGSWIASFPLGVRNGKRVRKRVRCRDEDAAWAELERLRRLYAGGGAPTNQTLDAFLKDWLASIKPTVEPSTYAQYENHVRLHISPLLGGIDVAKLRPADVRRLIADRLAAKAINGKGGDRERTLSPNTVAHIVTTLRIALETGVREQVLTINAAALAGKLPRSERPPVEPMTQAEAARLVAAFEEHWLGPLVRLLAGSGLRLGEALSLNQGDVYPEEGFVRIRKSKTTIRAVPVSRDALEGCAEARRRAPRIGKDEPLFFGPRRNRHGDLARLDRHSVSHAVPKVIEAAGLHRLTPHGFRHGVATILVSKGVHMRAIADQLGHANPSMTARVYAHVVPETQRAAVNLLDRTGSEG